MNSKIARHYICVTLYFSKHFHKYIVFYNNPVSRHRQSHHCLYSTFEQINSVSSLTHHPQDPRTTQCCCALLDKQMDFCENLKKASLLWQIEPRATAHSLLQVSASILPSLNKMVTLLESTKLAGLADAKLLIPLYMKYEVSSER